MSRHKSSLPGACGGERVTEGAIASRWRRPRTLRRDGHRHPDHGHAAHLATVHSIFGAFSAYLLLGLAWAVVYWGVDHVDNGALEVSNRRVSAVVSGETMTEVAEFSQFVYFSFVTMSMLGYGEIIPQGPVAQTLAWMQSVTGQFYIAVLVAWLVGEIPKHPVKRREK